MPGKTTSIKVIKERLSQNNCAPRKSLGQNFLADDNILQKIIRAGDLQPSDFVLEIGPGLGALTELLIERVRQVVAVEYDRGLFFILKENLTSARNLELLNQDIMVTDLSSLTKVYATKDYEYKVMANLPYYITTPIIFKLIESDIPWGLMVFLVQKEVADRLVAKPGTKEYGALTVMLNFYGCIEKMGTVPKTVFYPAPKVDSAIIRIIPDQRNHQLYPYLRRVVQASFGQRRKTILNALAASDILFGNKESIGNYLTEVRIDPQRRGETLTLPEFMDLAQELRRRESRGSSDDLYQPN